MKLSKVTKQMKSDVKREDIATIAQNMHAVICGKLLTALDREMCDPGVKLFWYIVNELKDLNVVYGGGVPLSIELNEKVDCPTIEIYASSYKNACAALKKDIIPAIVDAGYMLSSVVKNDSWCTTWEITYGNKGYLVKCYHQNVEKWNRMDRCSYTGVGNNVRLASCVAQLCIASAESRPAIMQNLAICSTFAFDIHCVINICKEYFGLGFQEVFKMQVDLIRKCTPEEVQKEDSHVDQFKAVLQFLSGLIRNWFGLFTNKREIMLESVESVLKQEMIIGGAYALELHGLLPDRECTCLYLLCDADHEYNSLMKFSKHAKAFDKGYTSKYSDKFRYLMKPSMERAILDYALAPYVCGAALDEAIINYIGRVENFSELYEVAQYYGKDEAFVDALICHALYNTDITKLID